MSHPPPGPPPPWIELRPGYRIRRLINGGWQLSTGHRRQGVGSEDPLEMLEQRLAAGCTTFDCADIYTGVEELLGEMIRRHRRSGGRADDLQIHTKLVPDASALTSLSAAYVRAVVERSLRRLGLERLDLVQLHWWDFAIPGWVEAMGWLDDLRREGKVRHLGVTNFDGEHLLELLEAGFDVVSNQVQLSLLDRRAETPASAGRRALVDLCAEHDVHLFAYGTLAGGFLGGSWLERRDPAQDGAEAMANRSLIKYRLIVDELEPDPPAARDPIESCSRSSWQRFRQLLEILDRLACEEGTTVANLAVRWALRRPRVAATIVGAGSGNHLEENQRLFEPARRRVPGPQADSRGQLEEWLRHNPGPGGPVFGLERRRGGRHAVIMKTELNRVRMPDQPSSSNRANAGCSRIGSQRGSMRK
ncbi:MAG: aldo/keto reductase [Holophagales bacterium]|nr:aldo/keto reductase [Holophagales bacterium]